MDSIDGLLYGTPVVVKWCACLYSCGWFIDADERSIRIAQDVNTDNKPCAYRSTLSILRDDIEDFVVFSESKQVVDDLHARLEQPVEALVCCALDCSADAQFSVWDRDRCGYNITHACAEHLSDMCCNQSGGTDVIVRVFHPTQHTYLRPEAAGNES